MADDFKAALAAEYSKWVAKDAIYIGNARAFNKGDAVPHSHIVRGIVPQSEVEAQKPAEKAVEAAK
jgi:hypothetical protein